MRYAVTQCSRVTNLSAAVNGKALPVAAAEEGHFLTALYRSLGVDYPKFFKMDELSKLGFLASELILRDRQPRFVPREDVAVICFNRSSSLATDAAYQATIQHEESCYPSPSVFVYTLPNIVIGEIAIRNKFLGETSFYVCEGWSARQMFRAVHHVFRDGCTRVVLAAWIECFEEACEAFMMLVEPEHSSGIPFSVEQIDMLYNS
jgi:3-oxoacyl-[acyl-carrier-protein] synthase-1